MCGIFCMLCSDELQARAFHAKHIEKLLSNRGPDSSKIVYRDGILFHGTVLHHQGDEIFAQPVESDDFVLLFNGDLYMEKIKESDTKYLFEMISKVETEDELLKVFTRLEGPFSIILLFKSKLYIARDALGRNSLLIGRNFEGIFLTSVFDPAGEAANVVELPPLGIFVIDIKSQNVELIPYRQLSIHQHYLDQLEMLKKITEVNLRSPISQTLQVPKEIFDFSFENICQNLKDENLYENLLDISEIDKTCSTFIDLLSSSVKERIERTQKFCKLCLNQAQCEHSNIGILFSGGVDCSLISILADKFIETTRPIDLMNVSFEKVSYNGKKPEQINWNVPDRLTGLETVEELKKLCPSRKWNFIEINVTRAELGEHLKKLSSLVFPLSNVLDESLGAALYFASRGVGEIDKKSYESSCRVILIGSGADELFGGYTRHRNAFKRSTPERDLLAEELNLDWVRLPSRNLARDDRVIGDHGITVRAPFIEENFVKFVQQLTPLQRCFPALPEGVGDKLLLRLCAHKLGLKNCSKFRKRALQFGSRVADKRQSAKETSILLTKASND